ncbi:hypothetical protein NMK43_08550 [Bacillus licheniformis]|uniref:hypothetical protein n=1 Tax=Bacillus licheniformis TaxID=1402 RepID=UPI0020C87C2E|nr:hypothetical protein [Bacillus licheniformis]MCP8973144.1 hypothetical protein [Bacillus licheniformis]
MDIVKLYNLIDGMVGDISQFKGLTFNLGAGSFTVDSFDPGNENPPLFLCHFSSHDSKEEIHFAAAGIEELRRQITDNVLM